MRSLASSTRSLRRGFTMLELLMVMLVIGVLITLGIVGYRSIIDTAENLSVQDRQAAAFKAASAYRLDNGRFGDLATMQASWDAIDDVEEIPDLPAGYTVERAFCSDQAGGLVNTTGSVDEPTQGELFQDFGGLLEREQVGAWVSVDGRVIVVIGRGADDSFYWRASIQSAPCAARTATP